MRDAQREGHIECNLATIAKRQRIKLSDGEEDVFIAIDGVCQSRPHAASLATEDGIIFLLRLRVLAPGIR